MNCCDSFGNCSQGRDCPARQPQPAEACTELGADDRLIRPSDAWIVILLVTLPWALVVGALAAWRFL